MDINDLKAKIFYYCREKLYHAMQEASLEGIKRFPGNGVFQLYNGLALVFTGKVNEGIRELDALQRDADVMLGSIVALQAAHKRCSAVDKEALATLDARLKTERKRASEAGLYHAANVLLHLGKSVKANEYVERLLKAHPQSVDGLVTKGWIELCGDEAGNASKHFESALDASPKNVDALFGKMKMTELMKNYNEAVALSNQLVSRFPAFTPPLVEKMRLQLALYSWDQALETCGRILVMDPDCLEAWRIKILSYLCRDADYEEAGLSLRKFCAQMEKREPANVDLYLENARLFSRICGLNPAILAETYRLAEKAAQLDPSNAELTSELGHQCLLQGRVKDAVRFYRNATKVDESSMTALFGLTLCQVRESGFSSQARQQIEFLREVKVSGPTENILLMAAQLESGNSDKAMPYLDKAVQIHLDALKQLPFGPKYLLHLDPDLLLSIVKEYQTYAPVQQSSTPLAGSLPAALQQCLVILDVMTKACPGLLEGLYQLARIQFLSGDLKVAAKTLQRILGDVDATFVPAHLLLAQILVRQGNYRSAELCLEQGISFNFRLREDPLYHLISALVHKQAGRGAESIAALLTAIRQADEQPGQLPLPDRSTLYLELAEAYRTSGQLHEAAKVTRDAAALFRGTSEEGRIIVANAELALHQADTQRAIELLDSIKPGHIYYNQACSKMADIHLHHRKDKRAFSECYRELVEHSPDSTSYSMLGDAYISIQEPDLAIEAYQQALKLNPRDGVLGCKMGKALIRCHLYDKAVEYYVEATKDDECGPQLKLDMAELYMRMGRIELAESAIARELDSRDGEDLSSRTKLLVLLSRVKEKAGDAEASLATLREARDNQSRVLKRAEISQSGEEERLVAAGICQKMAELSNLLRDNDAALRFYKEALVYSPGDTPTLIALANLYMQTNDFEQCQTSCTSILKADPNNESAMVMMADLAFRKTDFETASFHFQQLLAKRPNYWTALARLVEVMRRMGTLDEVKPFILRAEAATPRASHEAGLFYCKGLHEWYAGNRNAALKLFNGAWRDAEWGRQAVYNMVKICLSSEDDMLGYVPDDDDTTGGGTREMTLRMADKLLQELRPHAGGGRDQALSYRLLGNFLLVASGQKQGLDRAVQDLTAIASQEAYQDHVGVAYGLAVTYMAMKQVPRARNQLKRVAKYRWNFEDADYLESCWILLADIYIQNSKYDMASELVKRVLQYNRGSMKAYEYAGMIAEKEQSYREAAIQYDKAWKFGGRLNTAVGFKLAFNHMKSKCYADAIDVCQMVLKLDPDFPRIRKEILDKSRNNLRS